MEKGLDDMLPPFRKRTQPIFHKELKGNEQVNKVIDAIQTANNEIHELLMDIRNTQPELYDNISEVNATLMHFRRELKIQYDGYKLGTP